MKKMMCCIISVLAVIILFAFTAGAEETVQEPSDADYTQVTGETATGVFNDDISTLESDSLVVGMHLAVSVNGAKLKVSGYSQGNADVTKCGFTYVKIQRLTNGIWNDYYSFGDTDYYSDSNYCYYERSFVVSAGYYYRAVCEHYFEKPRLIFFKTTETYYDYTSSFYFNPAV